MKHLEFEIFDGVNEEVSEAEKLTLLQININLTDQPLERQVFLGKVIKEMNRADLKESKEKVESLIEELEEMIKFYEVCMRLTGKFFDIQSKSAQQDVFGIQSRKKVNEIINDNWMPSEEEVDETFKIIDAAKSLKVNLKELADQIKLELKITELELDQSSTKIINKVREFIA